MAVFVYLCEKRVGKKGKRKGIGEWRRGEAWCQHECSCTQRVATLSTPVHMPPSPPPTPTHTTHQSRNKQTCRCHQDSSSSGHSSSSSSSSSSHQPRPSSSPGPSPPARPYTPQPSQQPPHGRPHKENTRRGGGRDTRSITGWKERRQTHPSCSSMGLGRQSIISEGSLGPCRR